MQRSVPMSSEPFTDTNFLARLQQVSQSFVGRNQWGLLQFFMGALDVSMLGLAFLLAYMARFEWASHFFQMDGMNDEAYYRQLAIVMIPLWLGVLALQGGYQRRNILGGTREYELIFQTVVGGMVLMVLYNFLQPLFVLSRGWLLLAAVMGMGLVALGRFSLRRLVYRLRLSGYFVSPTVIVGANEEGRLLADQLRRWRTSGLYVVGFADKKFVAGTRITQNTVSLGTVEELDEVIRKYDIQVVVLASSAFSARDNMVNIFRNYMHSDKVEVRLSSGLYEIFTTGLTVMESGFVPLVGVNKMRLTGVDEVAKKVLDYGITIPGFIAILPIFLGLALAVRLTSPGPIFHRRRVMGANGKEFDAFKFRSMYVDGDARLSPEEKAELNRTHKLKKDPRITPIGAFIRRFSLDELPQLLNVLRGEMSLVGPRMISPAEMPKYAQWSQNLLTVRPGLTGLWQVSGRSDVSYEDRVRLDMYYIRNWTIWLDLQILFQTPGVVVRGRGAY